MKVKDREVLVSYDVSSLFTNVPVDKTKKTSILRTKQVILTISI